VHICFFEDYPKAFQHKCWAYTIRYPTMLLHMSAERSHVTQKTGIILT